jgi:geranylgeranyl reductase family protein
VGAGPGGAVAAMFLGKAGIPCLLVDKAIFPRDKICGDALSGKVIEVLKKLKPSIISELMKKEIQIASYGVKFIAPNLKELIIPIINDTRNQGEPLGFVSRRADFDNFLIQQAKEFNSIDLLQGCTIDSYIQKENGWILTSKDKDIEIEARLLIIADGAHSYFARHIAGIKVEPSHFCAGIRSYYRGIADMNPSNFIELYFLREFLPGYFWIIPLPNGFANVGVGMRSDHLSAKKINLKKKMIEIILKYPTLRKRFENAEPIEEVKGFGLPLGSKSRKISGYHFMLIGDAASLIDPFTGEGIGNAMVSGMLAAERAVKCISQNNFSNSYLEGYDEKVNRALWNGMCISSRLQKLAKYPWLFNLIVGRGNRSKLLAETISYIFVDSNMGKRLKNPMFYLKVLFTNK